MSKEGFGICRLCGNFKEMSFEHIPPKSAFNDQFVVFQTMQNMLEGRGSQKFRRGIGKYSLCEDCNKKTGRWYGAAFVDWTRQGLEWFDKLGDKSLFILPYNIRPLRVVKQTLIMALAMCSERTLDYHAELRKFVLNREQKYIPPKYRVYVYFNGDGQPRFASDMVIVKADSGSGSYVEAEVALPPFGYCISKPIKNMKSLAEYQGLYDITWFGEYDYNDLVSVHLRLPARDTHEPFPLDYRSKEEVESHHKKIRK